MPSTKTQIQTKNKTGALAKRRETAKTIRQITDGLFSSLVDFTLYSLLLLPAASFGKRASSAGVYSTFKEADEMLSVCDFQSFKNALRKLKEKGFISSIRDWQNKKIATLEGLKKLKMILPFYDEKRFWDGNLYILQYDISVDQNKVRDALWRFLKKLGAVKLQQSSYLLFSNPAELINEFLKDYPYFSGNTLISKLTKQGILGGEDISKFLWSRAGMDEVNSQYRSFIDRYKMSKDISKSKIFLDYFSILRKDPQIPFELLSDEYLGDEAYLLFLRLSKNTLLNTYVRTD